MSGILGSHVAPEGWHIAQDSATLSKVFLREAVDVVHTWGILPTPYISTCFLTLFSKHLRSSRNGSKHLTYLSSFNLPNNTISKLGAVISSHLTDREAEAP